jgi:VWFA-related protein
MSPTDKPQHPHSAAARAIAAPVPAVAGFLLPLLALALLLAFSSPARGQDKAEAPGGELFIERVDINVINVEAFVTDKDGNAVNDLTADDFEVYEDGKLVELSNFFQNDRVKPLDQQLERDRQMVAEGRQGRRSAPAVTPRDLPEDQRLNLVVYVDLYHLRPTSRTKVMKELGGFLEDRIHQGDRVMMIAHQRTLQMIHPFTQDIGQVINGIEKVAKMATNGQMADAERRRVRNTLFEGRGDEPQPGQLNPARADQAVIQVNVMENIRLFVQQQRLETENSMKALETVLRSLGGLPGRRALLYVSDGLEKQPGSDLFQIYTERYSAGTRYDSSAPSRSGIELTRGDLTDVYHRVTSAANTHQVTLYTLQARGAMGLGTASAEEGDNSMGMGGQLTSHNERLAAEQEPLIDLAEETGGSSIINSSNFGGALDSLSQDFNSLYSLGYRSRTGGDGKYHKIEVKVKRPGLRVRHRTGYVDSPQDQRVADRAFSSLILDLESNALGVSVDFATPQLEGLNKYHLPLLVRIPLRELALLPDGDKHKGKLRLFFAVQDPDGAISQVQEVPYPVEIPAAEAEQLKDKEIGYALKLAVREGTPKVAVSVWDEVSGIESYLLRSVPVGKKATKKAAR